jgi:hypothetical protein
MEEKGKEEHPRVRGMRSRKRGFPGDRVGVFSCLTNIDTHAHTHIDAYSQRVHCDD